MVGARRAAQLRLPEDSIIRNEFKYDLFGGDLSDIMSTIERDYEEIKRPTPATLTVYFYSDECGAPEVDPFFRLRTYAHFDPNATTLDEIKALPWQIERKVGTRRSFWEDSTVCRPALRPTMKHGICSELHAVRTCSR